MPEPVTLTWSVLELLRDRLRAITVANGYRTDVGTTVTLEPYQRQPDDGAVLTVVSSDVVPGEADTRQRRASMEITAEVHVPVEADNAQQAAHRSLADLMDCLGFSAQRDYTWPEGCTGITYTSRRVVQPNVLQGESDIVAQVSLRAGLVEKHVARHTTQ